MQMDASLGVDRRWPARVSAPLSAMLKHAACAAASNSSGLVPGSFENRVPNEYPALTRPLSVVMVPLPWAMSPSQCTEAERVMSSGVFMVRTTVEKSHAVAAAVEKAHAE